MFSNMKALVDQNALIVSLEYGIGSIINYCNLYDGIDDYFEVYYCEPKVAKHYCIKQSYDLRLLSSKDHIEMALLELDRKLSDSDIKNQFLQSQDSSISRDVYSIVKRIVQLCRRAQLYESDRVRLRLNIDSLVVEVGHVFKVDNDCARGIVGDHMKGVA